MAVEIKRTVLVEHEGVAHRFPEDIKTTVEAMIKITCDGPKCTGPDGKGPTVLEWMESNNPDDIPDAAYRLLVLTPFNGEKKVFCCQSCQRDYMRNYVPPKSPKEIAAESKHNFEAALKREEGAMPEVTYKP